MAKTRVLSAFSMLESGPWHHVQNRPSCLYALSEMKTAWQNFLSLIVNWNGMQTSHTLKNSFLTDFRQFWQSELIDRLCYKDMGGFNQNPPQDHWDSETTVNPNTLWSYFHADISVTECHIPSKLYTLTWYVKCEVVMQQSPRVDPTNHSRDICHRVSGFTVVLMYLIGGAIEFSGRQGLCHRLAICIGLSMHRWGENCKWTGVPLRFAAPATEIGTIPRCASKKCTASSGRSLLTALRVRADRPRWKGQCTCIHCF